MNTLQDVAALFAAAAILAISLAALREDVAPGRWRGWIGSRSLRVLTKVLLWIAVVVGCLMGLVAYVVVAACGPNAC